MAFRHHCPNADRSGSHRCPSGDGLPGKGPKRCPGCHGPLRVEEGVYGVFRFDPENRRYGRGDLPPGAGLYQRPAVAEHMASRLTTHDQARIPGHPGYVVRWIPNRARG